MAEFTKEYVLRTTLSHMVESVNISVSKTISRLGEFEHEPDKLREIQETLVSLNELKKMLQGIKDENADLLNDKDNYNG